MLAVSKMAVTPRHSSSLLHSVVGCNDSLNICRPLLLIENAKPAWQIIPENQWSTQGFNLQGQGLRNINFHTKVSF